RGGRRGRVRARPAERRGGARGRDGGDRGGGVRRGQGRGDRPRSRRIRAVPGRRLRVQEERRRREVRRGDGGAVPELDRPLPDRVHRGRARGRRLGGVG